MLKSLIFMSVIGAAYATGVVVGKIAFRDRDYFSETKDHVIKVQNDIIKDLLNERTKNTEA